MKIKVIVNWAILISIEVTMTACRRQEKMPVKKFVCEVADRSGLDKRPENFLFSAILNI